MFHLYEEGRNTETERMIFMQMNERWLNLGNEMLNMNAVSQVIKKKVNDKYAIEFFRLDGSYMSSVVYDTAEEADIDYNNIKDLLI